MSDFKLKTKSSGALRVSLLDEFRGFSARKRGGGATADMGNFKVTANGTLKKRCGFEKLHEWTENIRGIWHGKLRGRFRLILCAGREVCEYNIVTNTAQSIGFLGGAPNENENERVNFFAMYGVLYVMDGTDAYAYAADGVPLAPAAAYSPLLFREINYTGAGLRHELPNILTDKFRAAYNVNALSATLRLDYPVGGVEKILIDGIDRINDFTVTIDPATHYARLAYNSPPNFPFPVSAFEVHARFYGGAVNMRSEIFRNKYAADFGEDGRIRIFFYGKENSGAVYFTESIGEYAGLYIPERNKIEVGSAGYTVTSVVRQYEELVIFTERDAWAAGKPVKEQAPGHSNVLYSYPLSVISPNLGHAGRGSVSTANRRLCAAFGSGIYSLPVSRVFDERSVTDISERIKEFLGGGFINENLAALDNPAENELWFANNGIVWIYNYALEAWYRYTGIDTGGLVETGGRVIFYGGNALYAFNETLTTDCGRPVTAWWETDFLDFGLPGANKRFRRLAVSAANGSYSRAVLTADQGGTAVVEGVKYDTGGHNCGSRRTDINRCKAVRLKLVHDDPNGTCEFISASLSWRSANAAGTVERR